MRAAEASRKTAETDVSVRIILDGEGKAQVETGIGFFDHMLTAFARYALFDLEVRCDGDLWVDGHHTAEDCGIVLGEAISQALEDRAGIARVGHSYVPMDEALAFCALDLSNRPILVFDADFGVPLIGAYDTQLTQEFFRAVAVHAGITLHMKVEGKNAHHMTEALFKAFGKAMRAAAEQDSRVRGALSTKGVL